MERLGGEGLGRNTSIRRVVAASFVGSTIEWYDFFIYGTAAALVFGPLFFPEFDPLTGTLLAFGTFAVGFVSRPLGGVLIGHYGDKIGRKAMLVLTVLVMGVATFVIGLLPTYSEIGVWAPILLVTLRFLQGFGLGGEWGGAVLMAVEHAPEGRRGFYGSWPQMGAPAGMALSTGVLTLLTLILSDEQFLAWGWRVPFLLSIVLVGVGLFIRLKIAETPAFRRVKESRTESRMPVVEVLRSHPKNVALATGMHLGVTVTYFLYTVFVISYATTTLGVSRPAILGGVVLANLVMFALLPVCGALSDRVGRRPMYLVGALGLILVAFPFFWLVDSRVVPLMWLAVVLGIIPNTLMYATQASFFSELFGARVRYSGISLGYQLATLLGASTAPTVATLLLGWSGGSSWSISAYIALIGAVTLVSAYAASETFRSNIDPDARPAGTEAVVEEAVIEGREPKRA
jgi:metabolite-proton symporter